MAAPAFTVHNAMVAIGINNLILWNGNTQAERIATDVFDDDFNSCLYISQTELDDNLKMYSALTLANGQIRLRPQEKRGIKAFIQWSKDQLRVGIDPSTLPFQVADIQNLIRRSKDHKNFLTKKDSMSDNVKPVRFTEKISWDEWKPTLVNFLNTLPGRYGIPLKYVIRDNDLPIIDPTADMFQDYVNRAPLFSDAFDTDSAEVHAYIVKFISGNPTAEVKIMSIATPNSG